MALVSSRSDCIEDVDPRETARIGQRNRGSLELVEAASWRTMTGPRQAVEGCTDATSARSSRFGRYWGPERRAHELSRYALYPKVQDLK